MINHHPQLETLFDYSAGTLSVGGSVALEMHLSMCSECQRQANLAESLGGALLDATRPAEISPDALSDVLARLDDPVNAVEKEVVFDKETQITIPSPLRPYLNRSLKELAWKKVSRSIAEYRLPLSVPGIKASLMRVTAGSTVPRHSHGGLEYTLVLSGGFRDNGQVFERGDFIVRDASDVHQPHAEDDEDCLCLIVLEAPIKLTGLIGKIANPFLRI
ncbi:MAG: cupin domain-containing protein [Hyphomicrobiales bacterium]|nr:cupin domain-containing protein [Hyphomicrobiales bacterium]